MQSACKCVYRSTRLVEIAGVRTRLCPRRSIHTRLQPPAIVLMNTGCLRHLWLCGGPCVLDRMPEHAYLTLQRSERIISCFVKAARSCQFTSVSKQLAFASVLTNAYIVQHAHLVLPVLRPDFAKELGPYTVAITFFCSFKDA